MSCGQRARTVAGRCAALLAALTLASCAKSTRAPDVTAASAGTPVDSFTVALWRMDEGGGTHVSDSGPFRLDGTAGLETRTTFGRLGEARLFTRSNDSFLIVPYNPAVELPPAFTIEAWVELSAYSPYEASPIAVRWWPQTAEQSWMFCIVGSNLESDFWPSDLKPGPGPGWIAPYVQGALEGRLLFVLQPKDAGAPRAFVSQSAVELQRWVHVAVSYDGQVVRFWLDGQPDGTYANSGGIRASQAPLLLGNLFDTRFLTEFGGDLRQQPTADTKPWYTFEGSIDELRISSLARSQFPLSGRR